MQALLPIKIFKWTLLWTALSLPLSTYAQTSETSSEATNAAAVSHAEAAQRALDSGDDSLPTSADMDAAAASSALAGTNAEGTAAVHEGEVRDSETAAASSEEVSSADGGAGRDEGENRYLQAPPPMEEEPAGQDNRYLEPPPAEVPPPDSGRDDYSDERYKTPPPVYESTAENLRRRRAQAAARREENAWASIVRLEIGLGWSAGASTYEDIYGADTSISSSGPSAFLGVKFRLSPRVPLQLGIDASFTNHPWANNPTNSTYYGNFNAAAMGMGSITLTAFPTRNVYLMLGIGMGGLQQDVEARITSRGEETDRLKLGATGIAALGFEVHVARPFRFGIELRAFGGVFDRDSFGAAGAYALFSFF